jgi:two-component system, cell cycle sensor histidine kinase and response regulator CckA
VTDVAGLDGLAEFIIESALDGLVVIDSEGKIVAFNAAAGQIFGLEPQCMLGKTLEALFVPGMFVEHQRYLRDYQQGKGRGVVGSIIETEGWHSSGRRVPIEISLSEATFGEERIFLAAIRDITRRREDSQRQRALARMMVRAQRVDTLGLLAAGLTHDFGNTLGAIMGYASTLLEELPRRQRHYNDAAQILALAHRARRLSDALLGFGGNGERCSDPVALGRVVREVIGMLRRSMPRGIRIKLRLAPAAVVEGDAGQLEQCLMNLCLNARDAMPDGGELVISTRRLELGAGEAEKLPPGRYCVLAVRDEGVGMDPATLDKLGQPFFSTKPSGEGRGLGLNVVRTIVAAHCGAVRFQSAPGQGTEVQVVLPASEQPERVRAPRRQRRAARSRGETILLVDDDRSLRQMAKRLLGSLGYQVIVARTGEEAVRLYGEQRQQVKLVILDLQLVDQDGTEVLRELRELDPEVKVLLSSGLSRSEVRAHVGCGYLAKPYGMDEIAEAIHLALST